MVRGTPEVPSKNQWQCGHRTRLDCLEAISFTYTHSGCLAPQHQLYHSAHSLLIHHIGWCIACVMVKEMRKTVRPGYTMIMGNAGLFPLARTVVVLCVMPEQKWLLGAAT